MKTIQYLVVHCSDSPDGRDDKAADIHRWHLERGWSGIGYHFVIDRDGTLEEGRPLYWEGAHVAGFNDVSIGICLIGTKDFTDEQFKALDTLLLRKLVIQFKDAKIVGHCDLDPLNKPHCPGFNVRERYVGMD